METEIVQLQYILTESGLFATFNLAKYISAKNSKVL